MISVNFCEIAVLFWFFVLLCLWSYSYINPTSLLQKCHGFPSCPEKKQKISWTWLCLKGLKSQMHYFNLTKHDMRLQFQNTTKIWSACMLAQVCTQSSGWSNSLQNVLSFIQNFCQRWNFFVKHNSLWLVSHKYKLKTAFGGSNTLTTVRRNTSCSASQHLSALPCRYHGKFSH